MADFWAKVSANMRASAAGPSDFLNDGQKRSLAALATRLPRNGVIVADEVGMGKTRIAVATARAVIEAGGRVAIVIPGGLGYQWQDELRKGGIQSQPVLRNMRQFLDMWSHEGVEPWFKQKLILVSHYFLNWRITNSDASIWRWRLLPELYARAKKLEKGRFPHGYKCLAQEWDDMPHSFYSECACTAADSIIGHINSKNSPKNLKVQFNALLNNLGWKNASDNDATREYNYQKGKNLRNFLEEAIALGLGAFDLAIIDEAHKSRKEDSNLERLLQAIFLKEHGRRLALTATPVELDSRQWAQMLARIHHSGAVDKKIIDNYLHMVGKIGKYPEDEAIFNEFKEQSEIFENALKPFLLRRDKRAEESILKFKRLSNEEQDYRVEEPIRIRVTDIDRNWKEAICAAEALSFISSRNSIAQRLRLTIANGHGVSAMLDSMDEDNEDAVLAAISNNLANQEGNSEFGKPDSFAETHEDDNSEIRASWWLKVARNAFLSSTSKLYYHPAILRVASEIEKLCVNGEKVLLFGKFNAPLRALAELLNAREMLRRLASGSFWPQSVISSPEAVKAAWQQIRPENVPLDMRHITNMLNSQYNRLQYQRAKNRKLLLDKLEEGFASAPADKYSSLYKAFKEDALQRHAKGDSLDLLDRAMREIAGENYGNHEASEIRDAFIGIMHALADQDVEISPFENEKDMDDCQIAAETWPLIKERLKTEFNNREGVYARFMYGHTAPETRRYMQLSFNRQNSPLKVLISQSMVGREGLNLHEACKTIILLHPEWNPAVMEQQIGRIDRLGSLWEKKLNEMGENVQPEDLPVLEIKPVIFEGTYDERNWSILKFRWNELRAQLHGLVIDRERAKILDNPKIAERINKSSPNFYPDA